MRDEQKEKIIGVLWKAGCFIGAPFVGIVATSLLFPDWVEQMFAENALNMIAYTAIAFIAGLVFGIPVGYLFGGASKERARIKAQENKERLDREADAESSRLQREHEHREKELQRQSDERIEAIRAEAEKQKASAAVEQERIRAEGQKEMEERRAAEAETAKREREAADAERLNGERAALRRKLMHLPDRQKSLLMKAVTTGPVDTDRSDPDAYSLESDGLFEKLDATSHFERHWKATDLALEAVTGEDEELWASLVEGEGRQDELERRKALDEQQESFLALGFDARRFAYRVLNEGSVICDAYCVRVSNMDSNFIDEEDVGDGMSKYTINSSFADLFEERRRQCFSMVEERASDS